VEIAMSQFELKLIDIEKPMEMNFILGQTHFIKSIEDLYEAIVNSVPQPLFGIAFCEASGARKIRSVGTDDECKGLAEKNAVKIGAGHMFIIFMKNCFPLHLLHNIKNVPEVCRIFCATANPTKVCIVETDLGEDTGRGILGVIDGNIPVGIENKDDIKWRKEFLRTIKYKI
jgi:adenosine/AMP kinase